MVSIHDDVGLESLRKQWRADPYVIRRLTSTWCKKGWTVAELAASLSEGERERTLQKVAFHALTLDSRHDSTLDGASKLLFRTAGGQLLESVILRIRSGRTSLCVSSQVGCAVRCGFCATGQMGVAVSLRHDEILDQLVQANQILRAEKRSVRNVVFMGMGEPFHNEAEVTRAVEALLAKERFHLSPAHALVSTVGIPDAMIRFARRFPDVGLALSLHSARQDRRREIIPLANRHPLEQLREAIVESLRHSHRPIMIEYLLLADVNDQPDDLSALAEFCRGLDVHINLIPFNPIAADAFRDQPLTASPPAVQQRFARSLKDAGFRVTVRRSLGSDVAAACGQLVQKFERTRREQKAKS